MQPCVSKWLGMVLRNPHPLKYCDLYKNSNTSRSSQPCRKVLSPLHQKLLSLPGPQPAYSDLRQLFSCYKFDWVQGAILSPSWGHIILVLLLSPISNPAQPDPHLNPSLGCHLCWSTCCSRDLAFHWCISTTVASHLHLWSWPMPCCSSCSTSGPGPVLTVHKFGQVWAKSYITDRQNRGQRARETVCQNQVESRSQPGKPESGMLSRSVEFQANNIGLKGQQQAWIQVSQRL